MVSKQSTKDLTLRGWSLLNVVLLVTCISAVFWRKVLLVLKVILRYGQKVFLFFGPEKSSKEVHKVLHLWSGEKP